MKLNIDGEIVYNFDSIENFLLAYLIEYLVFL